MTSRWWAPKHPEALVVVVGAAGLVGWLLDVDVLKSISTGWSSMKANEALSFVLIGIGLVVLRPASSRRLRLGGWAFAVAAGAIGLLTIAEYAFSRDLGIDELLFRDDPASPGTGEPGRMSINSAIAFVLAGASLLLLDVRRPRFLRPAHLGAIAMSVLATVSVLSYLFSAPVEATGFSAQVMRVGLNTAIAFLLLGAAILQARPGVGVMALMTSPNAGGTLLRWLLPAAAVIVPTVGWLRLEGEEAGLYNFWVGLGIMVTSAITLLAVAVVVTGRFLERTDVERRRNLSQLQARTDELEAANKELESFSYSVSHDLRAPLRAIDGFSRILVTEFGSALDPAGQRYLRMVSDNARSMGELIDGLLAFSRLGQQSLSKRRVGVQGLVNDAIADVRPLIGVRDVEITVARIPRTVEADPTLLKQVFVNLLANAVKYTRQRDVARVEVGSYDGGGQMVFFVRDNGVGFDMRYADKLFRVFQRLHRVEEYEGAGIGLALVARIVRRHGGRVWAEAEPDRGATFFFTLDGAQRP